MTSKLLMVSVVLGATILLQANRRGIDELFAQPRQPSNLT